MAQTGLVRADFQQLLSKMQSREARMRDAHTPPRDDDDLAEWIWAYCGLKVPRVAVCPGHVAPLVPLADAFFERQMDQVWLANRGGAKTRGLSLLHHLNLMFKPGYEIASVGAIREQAERCYNYLKGYTELEWFHTDRQYQTKIKTVYKKGGSAEILSGTTSGCNSPHPHCLCVDEVELLPWSILQQAFSMPMSGGGFRAMNILTSTRKFRTGTMQRLIDMVEDLPSFGYKLYVWCIWEICAKCTESSCEHCQRAVIRDRDGELQSFWDVCGGKAKKADGFMVLGDIWRKFTAMDWDVFDAEWLGVRPGRVGQVFKGFSEDTHARRFPIDLGLFKQTAIVMDDGWTSPLAVLFLGRDSRDNLFCFDSLYGAEWAHDAVAEALREKFDLYGWSVPGRDEQGNDVKLYNQKPLYVDQRAPRTIHKFRTEFGFDARAIGAPVDEGNRWIRKLLTNRRRKTGALELLIHPDTCKELIDEFVTLHWPTDRDGSVTSDKYRGDDHLIDTLRYGGAVFGLLEGEDIVVQTSIDVSRPTARVPTNATWKRSVELRVQQQRSRWRRTRLPARYRR